MNIKFKNVHSLKYRALAFVLSLAVLLSGLVWYGVSQSSQQADAVYPSRNIVYVDTDFYDYYNDTMAEKGGTGSYAQGDIKRPFGYFNTAISQYAESNEWQYPLYFGQFWIWGENTWGGVDQFPSKADDQRAAASWDSSEENTSNGDTSGTKGTILKNFKWSANLSYRPSGDGGSLDNGYDSDDSSKPSTPQFYAAQQNLVDNGYYDYTKNNGDLIPRLGDVKLPYFDKNFLETTKVKGMSIAKVYDNKAYPFYATDEPVKVGVGYRSTNSSKVMTTFGPGYRFDSSKNGVYIDETTGELLQSNAGNTVKDKDGNLGFFPFNKTNPDEPSELNYGFGAKYSIKFKMDDNGNGTIDGEKYTGAKGTSEDNRAYFMFRGDDDVWVFIDDKLVLDMGGAHKQAEGYIDFANNEVGVLYSRDAKNNPQKIRINSSALTERSKVALDSKLGGVDLYDGKEHTLTVFYMERGMINSNFFMQFNMPTTPHEDMLTITDKVSVDKVNEGLQSQTLAVADSDVVNYTVSNKGTKPSEVHDTGLLYPGTDFVRRNNVDFPTQPQRVLLQGMDVEPVKEYIYLDMSRFANWTNDGAWFAAAFTNNGTDYHWVECDSVSNLLYRVKIPDTDYKDVIFCRMSNSTRRELGWGSVWNQCPAQYNGFISVNDLVAVQITGWDPVDGGTKIYGRASHPTYSGRPIKTGGTTQTDNKFSGGNTTSFTPVADTNYELVDPKAQIKSGSDSWRSYGTSSTAQKTSGSGALNLMYDQSAIFTGQFAPSTIDKQSEMQMDQSDTLYKPSVRNDTTVADFNTANGRTLSEYYNIAKPQLVYANDKEADGSEKTGTTTRSDQSGFERDTFEFKNISNTSEKVNIEAIYTREVKTGTVTITKEVQNDETTSDEFTMQVEMSNLFGTTSTLSKVENYENINITKSSTKSSTGSSTSTKLDSDGMFQMKAGETVTIDGIPVGTKVTIKETETGANWANVTITGGGVIDIEEGNGTVTVTNKRQTGTLTLQKKLAYPSGAKVESSDNTTPFKIKVTLTSSDSSIKWNELRKELERLNNGWGTRYSDGMNGFVELTNNKITADDADPAEIKGIPYGVTYTVEEIEVPDKWQYYSTKITEDGVSGEKTANSDTFDHAKENVVVTNQKQPVAYLTIEKYIDKLYYGEDDNAHGFKEGSSGVTSPLKGNKELDPFGYLNYTSAEQDFVFKIEKYNLNTDFSASPKPEPISTSYVVLKFDKDSERNEKGYGIDSITPATGSVLDPSGGAYKYKQSTTVKVDPGYLYKVSEVTTGISWRYELAELGIQALASAGGYALAYSGPSEYVAVAYGLKANFNQIPVARFFNKRTEGSQTIESDMSSITNKLTIKQ